MNISKSYSNIDEMKHDLISFITLKKNRDDKFVIRFFTHLYKLSAKYFTSPSGFDLVK